MADLDIPPHDTDRDPTRADDLAEAIERVLRDDAWDGPREMVWPAPAARREFATWLAQRIASSTPPRPLPDVLTDYARNVTGYAQEILAGRKQEWGTHAAAWMRSCREALEARAVAERLTDTERAAIASQIKGLRAQIREARDDELAAARQAGDVAMLVGRILEDLEDLGAHGELVGRDVVKLAARVRRELAAIVPDADAQLDAGEAEREATPA